jgi:hypothetical protein
MKVTKRILVSASLASIVSVAQSALAFTPLESKIVPLNISAPSPMDESIVLKNDSFNDQGGQAYLQTGFVAGEKAGVWVKVPNDIKKFKVDYFRVLLGNGKLTSELEVKNTQIFFEMGISDRVTPSMSRDIENAATITPGPYWNDIPAIGEPGKLDCARGGQYIGAALEFTHSGSPSVYRDIDGLANPQGNVLFAIPGGWNYSAAYGLRGDWILRVVGHEAAAGECN